MTNCKDAASYDSLRWWEITGFVVLAVAMLVFAWMVVVRSAYMQRRMTDAGVYFRAAWAVRTGHDLYTVEDANHWHYNYPPLLALLMVPLADAPLGEPRTGLLPYPVSVAIWFAINLLCGLIAAHWLAKALEETSPDAEIRAAPRGCRSWWIRRAYPFYMCLPPIAHTLMRGQVNMILLLLIAGMLRAQVRGRSGQAGAWLAGAICLKIIPAFLLLYPLWRRDGRFLGGCAVGLAVGLALIPGIALGPVRTLECYRQLAEGVLRPGLTSDADALRATELTNVTGTGSQSFVVVWHNTLYPDRSVRPDQAALWLRLGAFGLGGILALVTLSAACRRLRQPEPQHAAHTFVAIGALMLVMMFTSPVSHMHYQTLCLPLVMGLLVLFPLGGRRTWAWIALATVFIAAHILPHVPELSVLRDFGLPMYVGLLMWLLAVVALATWRPEMVKAPAWPAEQRLAA